MRTEISPEGDIVIEKQEKRTIKSEAKTSDSKEHKENKDQKIIEQYIALSAEVKRLKEKYKSLRNKLSDDFGFSGKISMSDIEASKRALAQALLGEQVENINKLTQTQSKMLQMQKETSSAILKMKLIEIDKVVS